MDPEGDPVSVDWSSPLLRPAWQKRKILKESKVSRGRLKKTKEGIAFHTEAKEVFETCVFPVKEISLHQYSGTVLLVRGHATQGRGGLMFGYQNPSNFYYWGIMADTSAWTLARVKDGKLQRLADRGAPIRDGHAYELSVRTLKNNSLEGYVDGKRLFYLKNGYRNEPGRIGLLIGKATFEFRNLHVSPPVCIRGGARVVNQGLLIMDPNLAQKDQLRLNVSDGHRSSYQLLNLNRYF